LGVLVVFADGRAHRRRCPLSQRTRGEPSAARVAIERLFLSRSAQTTPARSSSVPPPKPPPPPWDAGAVAATLKVTLLWAEPTALAQVSV